ncbi:hypothetical protein TNCV_1984611 [Trichonephila clavipes]|nr:hypothetical protein TNCV_1984611 [Trichonephila clavipes]
MAMWTRSLPEKMTVVLHIQCRIVIKDGKIVTVVFGACVGHLQVCEETRGEDNRRIMRQWSGKTERGEKKKKDRKRRGLVVFGKRKKRDLGVLDRDADDDSGTRIRKTPCGLYRDKLWRERLEKGATILARHRDNLILNII